MPGRRFRGLGAVLLVATLAWGLWPHRRYTEYNTQTSSLLDRISQRSLTHGFNRLGAFAASSSGHRRESALKAAVERCNVITIKFQANDHVDLQAAGLQFAREAHAHGLQLIIGRPVPAPNSVSGYELFPRWGSHDLLSNLVATVRADPGGGFDQSSRDAQGCPTSRSREPVPAESEELRSHSSLEVVSRHPPLALAI